MIALLEGCCPICAAPLSPVSSAEGALGLRSFDMDPLSEQESDVAGSSPSEKAELSHGDELARRRDPPPALPPPPLTAPMSAGYLDDLRANARHARERYQLYKARTYGPRPSSPARLRELQRAYEQAEARLHAAEAEARRAPGAGDGTQDAI